MEAKVNKPKCISEKTWERFQALQKKADNLTRRSTEKRIKHLQKTALEKVKDELHTEEDKEVLRQDSVDLDALECGESTSRAWRTRGKHKDAKLASSTSGWDEIRCHIGAGAQPNVGVVGSRSGLEQQIDGAIAAGEVHKAEALSDELSTRNFGVQIAGALSARDFLKRKKEEEELVKSKRKKKLHWGFEHKQRWETKGNM